MRTRTPTVWEDLGTGAARLEDGPPLDTPAWRTWLNDPATTSFAYPVYNARQGYIEGFMTVRKERRQRGGVYWAAYWRVGGRLRKAYLGPAPAVTVARLQTIATTWLGQHLTQKAVG
jgi:LuxR family transcriptional regulator, maltose regulon positive regulatory protein